MKSSPDAVPTKLLWVDLEMTGLDAGRDIILEVAAIVTDFEFRELAVYEARLRHERRLVEELMGRNEWWASYPANRDEFVKGLAKGKAPQDVERELAEMVRAQFGGEPAVLAGNSIHCDRQFIKHWWPALDSLLHYRMLDVSAWKVLVQGKYGVVYQKPDAHRARGDIEASIAELKYYLDYLSLAGRHGTDQL